MAPQFGKQLKALDLEEKILNGSSLLAVLCIFLPWISGEWLGNEQATYSGFGFFTSFLGIAIFLLQFFLLLVTIIPLVGGPVFIRRRYREWVRVIAASQSFVLALAALSVLLNITLEFSRMQIRFGLYLTLVATAGSTVYALLRLHDQRSNASQDVFSHPDDAGRELPEHEVNVAPPPPPPPPAPEPEEHRLYPPMQ